MTKPTPGASDYDEALPGAQTELAPSASETEAHTAWALDDGEDWEPAPWWTPGRITTAVAGCSAMLIAGAVVIAVMHLRGGDAPRDEGPALGIAMPTSSVVAASPPPVTITTVVVQPPAQTVTRQAPPPPSTPAAIPVEAPHPSDPKFLARLQFDGYTIYNPALAATRAHQVCGLLQRGFSQDYAVQQILSSTGPGPYADDDIARAQTFVMVATDVYPNCG